MDAATKAREVIRTYKINPNCVTRYQAVKAIREVDNMSMRYYLREVADLNRPRQ